VTELSILSDFQKMLNGLSDEEFCMDLVAYGYMEFINLLVSFVSIFMVGFYVLKGSGNPLIFVWYKKINAIHIF